MLVPTRGAARARPDVADVRMSARLDVLARRVRPRAGPVGRCDAVEVPRRRLGRAVGGARRPARSRRSRTRTRATGRTGSRCCARGSRPRRSSKRLTDADDGRDQRQLGVVDAQGRGATFTGSACHDWAGGRTGPGYAAQGNILVSGETVDALAESFEASSGSLAERLLEALAAAQSAGGDKRGQQSAALIVVERDGGYARPLRLPRRPACRRPRGADRGAPPPLRPAPATVRVDPARGVAAGRRRAARRDRRPPRPARP